MKPETRAKRALEKMEALGIEFTEEERQVYITKFLEDERSKEEKIEAANKSREAESVLALISRQDLFVHKQCRWKGCRGFFATNYAKVAYCSDMCRKEALEAIGISWNPIKSPEERWGYNGNVYHDDDGKLHNEPFPVPLVVPPEALKIAAQNPAVQQFIKESMLKLEPQEGPDPVPVEVAAEIPPETPKAVFAESSETRLLAVLGG